MELSATSGGQYNAKVLLLLRTVLIFARLDASIAAASVSPGEKHKDSNEKNN